MLKDLIRRQPNVFTDMPRETDVIQQRVKLKGDTPISCKPYLYATREELWNEVGQYARDGSSETINFALRITLERTKWIWFIQVTRIMLT